MSFLFHDINDTCEVVLCTDWQLDSNCVRLQTLMHVFNNVKEVSTNDVHFVYICNPWNAVTVSLSPYSFRLRLYAFLRTENAYCPVQYTKGTFNFNCEVNVSRGINNIYAVTLPSSGSSGGRNRDPALLLLLHPVHCCSTLVNLTDFVRTACVEQDPFCSRGFTGVNMRHDPNITCIFQGELSCHE
ncbi:hypothetical protein D3C73_503490 [compost metagenome]